MFSGSPISQRRHVAFTSFWLRLLHSGCVYFTLASALLNINELFDLDDRRKSPDRSGIQNVNKQTQRGRSSCEKKKQLLDVRYVLPM